MYDQHLVGKIRKNQAEELRISLSEHNGHRLISLRVWEYSKHHGDWFPGKKGLAMRLTQLSELADILGQAIVMAEGQGLATTQLRVEAAPGI